MQKRVIQGYTNKAKRDLLAFFLADSNDRTHSIFKYAGKKSNFDKIEWHSGAVFWSNQLKVLFEDDHFHWNIAYAIDELIQEKELNVLTLNSPIVRNELSRFPTKNIHRIKLVYHRSNRYYKKKTKQLLRLLQNWWTPAYFKGVGEYGETLTELTFRQLGFEVIGQNTNEINGKKYTKSDKNLDFILEKDGIHYGVEVKNTIGYPEIAEFREKSFELCDELELIPWWICRNAPNSWLSEIKKLEGFIYRNKALMFQSMNRDLADQIWFTTGIPVSTSTFLSQKIRDQIIKQHRRNKELFT